MAMTFDWYHRRGGDPWQLSACAEHGAQLVALEFRRGLLVPRFADLGAADKCALCAGTTSLDEVRACRCHDLGTAGCRVHGGSGALADDLGDGDAVVAARCAASATCLLLPCPDCGETISAVGQVDERGCPYLKIEHHLPRDGVWCPSIRFDPAGPRFRDVDAAETEHGAVWVRKR
jgi:hypothetical protein